MSCPPVIRSFGLIVQVKLAGPLAVNAPPDRASAIGVLRAAVTAGIDHIDTAQYYGPDVVNDLIREALYPYPGELAIVSKVGVFRDAGAAVPHDDARQLREGIEDNLRSLRLDPRPGGVHPPWNRLRAVLPARLAARPGQSGAHQPGGHPDGRPPWRHPAAGRTAVAAAAGTQRAADPRHRLHRSPAGKPRRRACGAG